MIKSLSLAACLALTLPMAACNQTSATAPSGSASAPAAAAGCKAEIAEYRAIMSNDLSMGHVNQSVYTKVAKEIERADAACASGRDGEAARMIDATKGRYGYR